MENVTEVVPMDQPAIRPDDMQKQDPSQNVDPIRPRIAAIEPLSPLPVRGIQQLCGRRVRDVVGADIDVFGEVPDDLGSAAPSAATDGDGEVGGNAVFWHGEVEVAAKASVYVCPSGPRRRFEVLEFAAQV